MDNTWQLYSCIQGWCAISNRLDAKLATALRKLDRDLTKNITPKDAALTAYKTVSTWMRTPDASNFGTCDGEPLRVLCSKINRHLKDKHNMPQVIDAYHM